MIKTEEEFEILLSAWQGDPGLSGAIGVRGIVGIPVS